MKYYKKIYHECEKIVRELLFISLNYRFLQQKTNKISPQYDIYIKYLDPKLNTVNDFIKHNIERLFIFITRDKYLQTYTHNIGNMNTDIFNNFLQMIQFINKCDNFINKCEDFINNNNDYFENRKKNYPNIYNKLTEILKDVINKIIPVVTKGSISESKKHKILIDILIVFRNYIQHLKIKKRINNFSIIKNKLNNNITRNIISKFN